MVKVIIMTTITAIIMATAMRRQRSDPLSPLPRLSI